MADKRYSVKQLAQLSGLSVRTLHHYDEIGLLVPQRKANGYRTYGAGEVRRLHQILVYRACGLELSQIATLLDGRRADELGVLQDQLARLQDRRRSLDETISNVERTIQAVRKGTEMTDSDRFEELKRKSIRKNEERYGTEARKRHGDQSVEQANETLLSMDERTWNDMNALEERIKTLLSDAMVTGDVAGEKARELVTAHARWLSLHWGEGAYNAEAHRGLADGYLADERFVAYYDGACGQGATQFLRDAIHALA